MAVVQDQQLGQWGLQCDHETCTARYWPEATEKKTSFTAAEIRYRAKGIGWRCTAAGDFCSPDHCPTEVR